MIDSPKGNENIDVDADERLWCFVFLLFTFYILFLFLFLLVFPLRPITSERCESELELLSNHLIGCVE